MVRSDVGFDADDDVTIVERVAAIDIAKASGTVCVRVPHPSIAGRRSTRVWEVGATTNAIIELVEELAEARVERVVVESTSDYWRPFVYLLQARGLTTWLVNARDVKQVPGRPKTDKVDAVWLAKLNERGMLRPSFVPPVEIRELRDYTRLRHDLSSERGRHKQRMEKLLEDALIKLSTVATDIFGLSGRMMIDALIAGERDPRVLADMAHGRMKVKRNELIDALSGRFDAHHAELAQILLDQVDTLNERIDQLTARIEQLIAKIPAAAPPAGDGGDGDQANPTMSVVERLDEIAGVGEHTAQVIIAEIGLDMAQFPTPAHLVSWAKLAPRTIQSGPKHRAGKTGKGNPYLRKVLGDAAVAAGKTNTFLGARYRRLVPRRGKLKAVTAISRSILVIAWYLINDPNTRFHDLGADYYDTRLNKDRKTRNLVHQLQALGHNVTLTPAAA